LIINLTSHTWKREYLEYKMILVPELGCAYRWNKKYKQIEWCPMGTDGTLCEEEWDCVDEDLVGDEVVTYQGKEVTLSEVYRDMESKLNIGV
jgi:hypothetical protein